ncbi:hypothetical protein CTM62_11675 [Prevotella intermedia]|uniref:Uncharacterized protein n=2 Tax=Prevotella intermedia TaxID=28131 RepID=A0A2D3LA00_PREIN|nr:hypothetical protein CTM62_11675 [Prevotella intermedia]
MVQEPCQSTARSLQYEVALNVIEIVIMSVPENPAAPAILPITAVTAMEDVAHGIGYTVVVRAVLIAEFSRKLHYSQMFLSKFPDEIVRVFQFNFVKIILLKSDNYALMLRKRLFCDAKPMLLPCKTATFGTQNNRFCNALMYNELCRIYAFEKYLHLYYLLFIHTMLVTNPLKALFLDCQTLHSTVFCKIFQKTKQA